MEAGERLAVYRTDGYWNDVGTMTSSSTATSTPCAARSTSRSASWSTPRPSSAGRRAARARCWSGRVPCSRPGVRAIGPAVIGPRSAHRGRRGAARLRRGCRGGSSRRARSSSGGLVGRRRRARRRLALSGAGLRCPLDPGSEGAPRCPWQSAAARSRTAAARRTSASSPAHSSAGIPSRGASARARGRRRVLDSRRVRTLARDGILPRYYVPLADVRQDLLEPTDHHTHCPFKGDASYLTLRVGERVFENAAWHYPEPVAGAPTCAATSLLLGGDGRVVAGGRAGARPRARPVPPVDVRELGATCASRSAACCWPTRRGRSPLFETGLPVRWYLPRADVRVELRPSDAHTTAPTRASPCTGRSTCPGGRRRPRAVVPGAAGRGRTAARPRLLLRRALRHRGRRTGGASGPSRSGRGVALGPTPLTGGPASRHYRRPLRAGESFMCTGAVLRRTTAGGGDMRQVAQGPRRAGARGRAAAGDRRGAAPPPACCRFASTCDQTRSAPSRIRSSQPGGYYIGHDEPFRCCSTTAAGVRR